MTYGQLKIRFVKAYPGVDLELIEGWIGDVYADILHELPWQRQNVTGVLQTLAPYATGTVACTTGSNAIQGAGTAWTPAMSGMQIRMTNPNAIPDSEGDDDGGSDFTDDDIVVASPDDDIYTFTYVGATSGTLDRPYEGTGAATAIENIAGGSTSGTVATVDITDTDGFAVGCLVNVAGASPIGLNVTGAAITAVVSNVSISYANTTPAAPVLAQGTISAIAVQNITGGSTSGTVATVNVPSTSGFIVGGLVNVAGASPVGVNVAGAAITAVGATSISYANSTAAGAILAQGTISGPGLAYSIFQSIYTMPANCRLLDDNAFSQFSLGPLLRMDWSQLNQADPSRSQTGTPGYWATSMDDDSTPPNMQVELYPVPDQVYALPYKYQAEGPALTGTSVTLLAWLQPGALIEGVTAKIKAHLKDIPGAQFALACYNRALKTMRGAEAQGMAPANMQLSGFYIAHRWKRWNR
jgi:hypothetical protein